MALVGVDEVGRGCLAGPVFAAAVILPEDYLHPLLRDSKKLSEKQREEIFHSLITDVKFSVGIGTLQDIKKINILYASLLAMKRAVLGLGLESGDVYVDGNQLIPDLPVSFLQTTIIKGDQKVPSIAAASIIAKVLRDRLMNKIGKDVPQFNFTKNKGYGTADHRSAIEKWGPTIYHRELFKGVQEHWSKTPIKKQQSFNWPYL